MSARPERQGLTLIELILSLAVLGLLSTLVGVAAVRAGTGRNASLEEQIAPMRRAAVTSGRDTAAVIETDGVSLRVFARSTGQVLVDSLGRATR